MSDFLFVLIIILIVFGVFRRYIFFFLMTALSRKVFKEMNKMQERQANFNQQQQQQQHAHQQEPLKGKSRKSVSNDHGEYVDFEELKD
jgi:predicted lipid-binding transport protein (Tim44 family)